MKKDKLKSEEENNLVAKIMVILFASGEPVSIAKLSKFIGINKKKLLSEIENIRQIIKSNNLGLDFVINQGKIQMVSDKEQADLVIKFFNKQLDEKISPAALETLAVVAYRGPMTRAQIEYIRGVNCSFTLRNLAMRGLVDFSENPNDNRSYLYQASGELLKNLGINKIDQLPDYKKLNQKENESGISKSSNKEKKE